MRSEFVLVPLAALAGAPSPVEAKVYLSVEEAQQLLFPNAEFTDRSFYLEQDQMDAIRNAAGVTQWSFKIMAWRVSTGGWFFVDSVLGRDDTVLYALGLTDGGEVTSIEIIQCLPEYDLVRIPEWREQFVGFKRGQYGAIRNISGVTLSSQHISEGVRRVLVIYDMFYKDQD